MNNKDREIKVLRDVLQSIIDIGFDYDGYGNSLEGCKSLIDEFVSMSKDALNGKGITYLSNGKIVTTWASGKANTEEPITESMVTKADGTEVNMKPTSFDSTNKAQETLKIAANGQSKEYTIEITNDINIQGDSLNIKIK